MVKPGDQLTLITAGGKALRTRIDDISIMGRSTSGVQLMKMPDGDTLASIALLDQSRIDERMRALEAESHELVIVPRQGALGKTISGRRAAVRISIAVLSARRSIPSR